MPKKLYDEHQKNLELAKELGAVVEFNGDFEKWFSSQVAQVAKELARMREDASKQVRSGKSKESSTMNSSTISTTTGKKGNVALTETEEVADGDN